MSIINKHILKNVFSKPFRTLLLVFCIMVCAFVAEVSMDITDNMELILKTMITQIMGTSDMIVQDEIGATSEYQISEDARQLLIYEGNAAFVMDMKGEYNYYQKKAYSVECFDYNTAYEMKMLGKSLELSNGETAISALLARTNDLKVGDTITLIDINDEEHSFNIKEILPNYGHANGRKLALLNEESFKVIYGDVKVYSTYIDVKDDSKAGEVKREIEAEKLGTIATVFMDSEDNKEVMHEMKMILLLIFSICLFLVIFVTMSVSKRIIAERMSVVGTFRSLGMSSVFTTKLLILENAIYGFLGSLAGVGVYMIFRTPILSAILSPDASSGLEVHMDIPEIKIAKIILILVAGILVECICPIKEILLTTKMSIRDIIFDNKDTAFKMSTASKIVGFTALAVTLTTYFISGKMEVSFVCFVCGIVALSQLFPYILKGISKLLAGIFDKAEMPVAGLAARECFKRKSTVGSSVLAVTAATISILMFVLLASLNSIYDIHTYDADLIFEMAYKTDASVVSYVKDMDGVSKVEEIYSYEETMLINNVKADSITIVGLNEDGFDLFTAIKGVPEHIENDEFYIDENLARKYNIEVGDEVNLVFDYTSFIPMEKNMKCAGFIDSFDLNTTANTILISKSFYKQCFNGYISHLLVRCDNPDEIKETVNTYSGTYIDDSKTIDEYNMQWQEKKNGMKGMVALIIVLGVGITVIGMVSNQLIGFEGRKRECAVLVSTSMTREKCGKMLFYESVISSGAALIASLATAGILLLPLKNLLVELGMVVPVTYNVLAYLVFIVILWAVFSLISVFPIRALYKMNLAEQLKYTE